MSQADAVSIIRAYLYVLLKAGIPITKAYLYGSYARNRATDDSDIDVMLISDSFDTADDVILSQPWLFTTNVDHRIEPVAVGTQRFLTDDVSPLIGIVRKEGIEILPG
jgi:predicted nucleotidyltransferase